MYNRYVPNRRNGTWTMADREAPEAPKEKDAPESNYTQVESGPQDHPSNFGGLFSQSAGGSGQWTGKLFGGDKLGDFGAALKALKLDELDSGDILLILIILFLLVEGDNLELVITLGLMLLLGLGDQKKQAPEEISGA